MKAGAIALAFCFYNFLKSRKIYLIIRQKEANKMSTSS
jgi:hypothetical protein